VHAKKGDLAAQEVAQTTFAKALLGNPAQLEVEVFRRIRVKLLRINAVWSFPLVLKFVRSK